MQNVEIYLGRLWEVDMEYVVLNNQRLDVQTIPRAFSPRQLTSPLLFERPNVIQGKVWEFTSYPLRTTHIKRPPVRLYELNFAREHASVTKLRRSVTQKTTHEKLRQPRMS